MPNSNKLIIIILALTCVTACKEIKKMEYAIQGRDYDKEMANKGKREADNIANAKGYNFHNYDVIGFKTGSNIDVVNNFIQKNSPSKHSRNGFKGEFSNKTAYLNGQEAVLIGTTGIVAHDIAYYITRIKEYNHLSGPEKHNLTQQLFEKYGPPTISYTEEPKYIFGIGRQKYYKNEYGMTVPEALVTEYYWQFDKEGNLKPKNEELSHMDHKFFSTKEYKLLTSDTREYLDTTEMVRPPRLQAETIFNKFHVVRCQENCGFQLTVAVISRYSDNVDRVIRYSTTLVDMTILDDATSKAKEYKKKLKDEKLNKERNKNMQINL